MTETWLHGQTNASQGIRSHRQSLSNSSCPPKIYNYPPAGGRGFTGFLWKGTVYHVDSRTLKMNASQKKKCLIRRIYARDLNLDDRCPVAAIYSFTWHTKTTSATASNRNAAHGPFACKRNGGEISSSRKRMNNKLLLRSFKFQAVGFNDPYVDINKLPVTQWRLYDLYSLFMKVVKNILVLFSGRFIEMVPISLEIFFEGISGRDASTH